MEPLGEPGPVRGAPAEVNRKESWPPLDWAAVKGETDRAAGQRFRAKIIEKSGQCKWGGSGTRGRRLPNED